MSDRLQGKRLLLIGGSNFASEILEYTKKHGITIIATGNRGNSPLKEIADECYDVDTTDVPQMIELAKRTHVDGIFAGGSEPNILASIQISETLGLPYYCNRQQWDALMNKANFKKLCYAYGVATPKSYDISTVADIDHAEIHYPVVVKPVDSCGSNGVVRSENQEELKAAAKEAIGFSSAGKIIVEEYISGEEISAVYTICHGEITLSCLKEKYPVVGIMGLPNVYIYPSKHLERYVKEVNGSVTQMLKSLGLQYGTLSLQGFANDSGIYIFEAGYRPEGTSDFRYTDAMNGVNHVHLFIEHALTGTVEGEPNRKDNPKFLQRCGSLTLCAKGGKVARILGLEKLAHVKEIKAIDQFYHEGDEMPSGVTDAQRLLRFFIISDDLDGIVRVIKKIQDSVEVLGENGDSILFDDFDTRRLYGPTS